MYEQPTTIQVKANQPQIKSNQTSINITSDQTQNNSKEVNQHQIIQNKINEINLIMVNIK